MGPRGFTMRTCSRCICKSGEHVSAQSLSQISGLTQTEMGTGQLGDSLIAPHLSHILSSGYLLVVIDCRISVTCVEKGGPASVSISNWSAKAARWLSVIGKSPVFTRAVIWACKWADSVLSPSASSDNATRGGGGRFWSRLMLAKIHSTLRVLDCHSTSITPIR